MMRTFLYLFVTLIACITHSCDANVVTNGVFIPIGTTTPTAGVNQNTQTGVRKGGKLLFAISNDATGSETVKWSVSGTASSAIKSAVKITQSSGADWPVTTTAAAAGETITLAPTSAKVYWYAISIPNTVTADLTKTIIITVTTAAPATHTLTLTGIIDAPTGSSMTTAPKFSHAAAIFANNDFYVQLSQTPLAGVKVTCVPFGAGSAVTALTLLLTSGDFVGTGTNTSGVIPLTPTAVASTKILCTAANSAGSGASVSNFSGASVATELVVTTGGTIQSVSLGVGAADSFALASTTEGGMIPLYMQTSAGGTINVKCDVIGNNGGSFLKLRTQIASNGPGAQVNTLTLSSVTNTVGPTYMMYLETISGLEPTAIQYVRCAQQLAAPTFADFTLTITARTASLNAGITRSLQSDFNYVGSSIDATAAFNADLLKFTTSVVSANAKVRCINIKTGLSISDTATANLATAAIAYAPLLTAAGATIANGSSALATVGVYDIRCIAYDAAIATASGNQGLYKDIKLNLVNAAATTLIIANAPTGVVGTSSVTGALILRNSASGTTTALCVSSDANTVSIDTTPISLTTTARISVDLTFKKATTTATITCKNDGGVSSVVTVTAAAGSILINGQASTTQSIFLPVATRATPFSISLSDKPSADVSISCVTKNAASATVGAAALTFTALNYNVPQAIATASGVAQSNTAFDCKPTASTGGYTTTVVASPIVVVQALEFSNGETLKGTFGQALSGFTVKLTTNPGRSVRISCVSVVPTKAQITGTGVFEFNAATWGTGQAIPIQLVATSVTGDNVKITCTGLDSTIVANGQNYNAITAQSGSIVSTAPAITLTAGTVYVGVAETSTNSLSVKLATRPSANGVIVRCTSTDTTKVANPVQPTYIFTIANYNIEQFVTITGTAAGDSNIKCKGENTVGGYSTAVEATSLVTVAGEIVGSSKQIYTTTSIPITSYNIVLGTKPTAAVTVTCASGGGGVVVNTATYTFTTTNWNVAQTVSMTAGAAAAPSTDITCTPNAVAPYNVNFTAKVKVTVNSPAITVTAATAVAVGKSTTSTIALGSAPGATVTVTCTSADLTVVPNSVPNVFTFTAQNFDAPQTMTYTPIKGGSSVVTCKANNATGSGYTSTTTAGTVTVQATGLVVNPTILSSTVSDTYGNWSVKLSTVPVAGDNVTVTCVSSDITVVTIPETKLTFTSVNFAAAQTRSLTMVKVGSASINCTATQTAALATNTAPYNGLTSATAVTVAAAGVNVSDTSVTMTQSEIRTSTVVLSSDPGTTVTVTCGSSNTQKVVLQGGATFVFMTGTTAVNAWNKPRTFSYQGASAGTATITCTAVGSTAYNNVKDTLAITVGSGVVVNNATINGLVSATSSTTGVDFFTWQLKLSTAPVGGNTTVTCKSSNTAVVNIATGSETTTFTATDFVTYKTIPLKMYTAGTATLTCTPTGGGFDGSLAGTTTVTNALAGLTVSTSSLALNPTDITNNVTVVLQAPPTSQVTVTCTSQNLLVVGNPSITTYQFNATGTKLWNVAQTISPFTATGIGATTIDCVPAGGSYTTAQKVSISVTVTGKIISSFNAFAGTVGFEVRNYTIKLGSAPTGTVTVNCYSTTSFVASSPSPSQYTFTAANWQSAQAVDFDLKQVGTSNINCAANGGGFTNISTTPLVVTVGAAGVVVTPASVSDKTQQHIQYTVKLSSAPSTTISIKCTASDVTVVKLSDSAAGANQAAFKIITFQPSNYSVVNKTIFLSLLGVGSTSVICEPTANSGGYSVTNKSTTPVTVAGTILIRDSNVTTNLVDFKSFSGTVGVTNAAAFYIKLGSQPTGQVTVTCLSSVPSAVIFNGNINTFTFEQVGAGASSKVWSEAQAVNVDFTSAGVGKVTCTGAGGNYAKQLYRLHR